MALYRRFWQYAAQKIRPFFDVNMNGKKISGLPTSGYPTGDSEVSTKKYVDDKVDGDMLKATYDTEPNDVVDNAEKLEGSAKAEVQDHPVKDHALSAHSAPSSNVNMAGKKITKIGEPTEDQDIATKKYADKIFSAGYDGQPPYKIAFACSNNLTEIQALAEGGMNLIHVFCNWVSDAAVFSIIEKCVQCKIMAVLNLAPANQPDPFYGSGGYHPGYIIRLATFKNEAGLFGLQIEEPYMRGISVAAAQDFYSYAKTQNPDWKIWTSHADDEWNRHGFCVAGYTDLCGTNLYGTPANVESKLVNLGYAAAHKQMWTDWGIQCIPTIYGCPGVGDERCPDYIKDVYDVWNDKVGNLFGVAYYPKSCYCPPGGSVCMWTQIKLLNAIL